MKKVNLLFFLLLSTVIAFTSCTEEETPSFGNPTVQSQATASGLPGEEVDIAVLVSAPAGVSRVTVSINGGEETDLNVTAGEESANITHTFMVPEDAEEGSQHTMVYVVYDESGNASVNATTTLTIGEGPDTIEITNNIESDMTWETGKTYLLKGRISVTEGNTLSIEPGVVVKGAAGSGSNATALVIARGATIMAEGEPESPIIFTSVADEIEPGQIASPNLEPSINGLWGGLLILGKAHGSFGGNVTEVQIEGIPASDPNGLYGGEDDEDNSGVLKYVSIRHGGANIGEGNEINGLTLGCVGSGTVIENVEIIGNQDDGIEWFGGTVNVTNAVVWNAGDDAIDADQAWNGILDNFFVVSPGDKCFELDGPEGSYINGNYTLKNGTVIAGEAAGLVDNDENTNVDMSAVYFTNLTAGQTFDILPTVEASFYDLQATLPEGGVLANFFLGGSLEFASEVAAGENTVGADKEVFAGWSWTSEAGKL
ncbi:hypothetical protein QWY93_08680 [Echinicola jeungdonensis]|uniref:Lipoprotein n=1 Tax=Echinicola jeungdonensis TaxID=709343 RepID=A0ABV5J8K1_9BACT|nr:hypothetical protein [Echinicola jeungdonensis]MDN3669403.1 hypothetical protein [Echinicola jeungdonensis]